jgi:hypothetical protein
MIYITKSDRWLGYTALVCAATAILMFWNIRHELLAVAVMVCLGPFGLYLALRGLFVGSWLSRICAFVALAAFGWLTYMFIAAITAHAKIHT